MPGCTKGKTSCGKTHVGVERSTFLIDEQGILSQQVREVKVDGHVEEVPAALSG